MNEVNKTLFIPLYGKARVSRQGIILDDPSAEKIREAEWFPIRGRSGSKWLAYTMAMRARVFDDWTDSMIARDRNALVLHIGCGLDSRYERVKQRYGNWIDCDLPDVIAVRRKHFAESECYRMTAMDASDPEQLKNLPKSNAAIVILEGISMYLTNDQLRSFLCGLQAKYPKLHILMDIYTGFAAAASRFANPINDVGVTGVFGIDDVQGILTGSDIRFIAEHSFTPERLVNELPLRERAFFRLMFTGWLCRKLYRLIELELP